MLSGQNFVIDVCGEFILNDPKFLLVKENLTNEDKNMIGTFLVGREKYLKNEKEFFKSEGFKNLTKKERDDLYTSNHILREQLSEIVTNLTPKLL